MPERTRPTALARTILLLAVLAAATSPGFTARAQDPLAAWNDGPTKQAITQFVRQVTDPSNASSVKPEERVATIDNDGTLWCEKPIYTQVAFVFQRVGALAPMHPEWKTQQPFQAILERDQAAIQKFGAAQLFQLIGATSAGMTEEQFAALAREWLAAAKHPRFGVPYTQLTYPPMVELLAYLRANGFKTYIVTGGEADFVRAFASGSYGVPPEQVMGTSLRTEFQEAGTSGSNLRLPALFFNGDGPGKPANIALHVGRRPILAAGNSDGDIQMLEYNQRDGRPYLNLLVHHDDAVREYAYDTGTEKALTLAAQRKWTVVSMKQDFRRVFASN